MDRFEKNSSLYFFTWLNIIIFLIFLLISIILSFNFIFRGILENNTLFSNSFLIYLFTSYLITLFFERKKKFIELFQIHLFPTALLYSLALSLQGILVFLIQILNFLKSGSWKSFSFLEATYLLGFTSEYYFEPQSWIGIHKILSFISYSIGTLLISAFILSFALILDHNLKKEQQSKSLY